MNMCLVLITEKELFESGAHWSSLWSLWVIDWERNLQKKDDYTRRNARSHFGCCCARKKKVKINSDEWNAIFRHELQSALRLAVGFSNIYCAP